MAKLDLFLKEFREKAEDSAFFQIQSQFISERDIEGTFVDRFSSTLFPALKGPSPILLEGRRGTGKTNIFKYVQKLSEKNFETERILILFIDFTVASKVSNIRLDGLEYDIFRNWLILLILGELYRELSKLGQLTKTNLFDKIFPFTKGNQERLHEAIKACISQIERIPIRKQLNTSEKGLEFEKMIKFTLKRYNIDEITSFRYLNELPFVKEFIETEVIETLNLKRIVVFFDEVVQAFTPEVQKRFFTFMKAMQSPYIACKSAIYPGITNYGPDFDKNQDATRIVLDRYEEDPQYLQYFKELINKRLKHYLADDWTIDEIIELDAQECLAYGSMGNPRRFIQFIADGYNYISENKSKLGVRDSYEILKNRSMQIYEEYSNRVKNYANYLSLENRLNDLKGQIIDRIQDYNDKASKNNNYSHYFAVSLDFYRENDVLFDFLDYCGYLYPRTQKMVKNTNSKVFAYDLCNIFEQKIFSSIANIKYSVENAIRSNLLPLFEQRNINFTIKCENCQNEIKKGWKMCPNCGEKIDPKIFDDLTPQFSTIETVYAKSLSEIPELKRKFYFQDLIKKFPTIKDVIEVDQIKCYQVGPSRSREIKSIVEEFVNSIWID